MKKKIFIGLCVSLCFSACKKADIGGMFIATESANERFEQSMAWNASHPFREISVPADDYVVFSMSDSHVGGTVNLDTFLSRAAKQNVAALVMAGDLSTGNESDYVVLEQHLKSADTMALFPVTGNHDLYFGGWEQFYARFGSSTYLFTVKTPTATDLYICLESGGGTLGSLQMEWLKNLLENNRNSYRRCIVFTHLNFFRFRHTASTNPVVEELRVLIELFTKYRVDIMVTGHDHEKDAEIFGKTTYIVMDALVDSYEQAGYLTFSVKNGSIGYDFISF